VTCAENSHSERASDGLGALVTLSFAKFAFHIATHRGYGISRDELYYLACASRLDWGYVLDRGPGEGASRFHLSIGHAF